jgi:hypothetical protein
MARRSSRAQTSVGSSSFGRNADADELLAEGFGRD